MVTAELPAPPAAPHAASSKGPLALSFGSSGLLIGYNAGAALALAECPEFFSRVRVVHGVSGGAVVAGILLGGGPTALRAMRDYISEGHMFRKIGLAEVWDPARLIPGAIEEAGCLPADVAERLGESSGRALRVHLTAGAWSGRQRRHVVADKFESKEALIRTIQASSSFAWEGVALSMAPGAAAEPHWDGGLATGLCPPADDELPTVLISPLAGRHVDICPPAGRFAICGWYVTWANLVASWDVSFMFSVRRVLAYYDRGYKDAKAFLRAQGYLKDEVPNIPR